MRTLEILGAKFLNPLQPQTKAKRYACSTCSTSFWKTSSLEQQISFLAGNQDTESIRCQSFR